MQMVLLAGPGVLISTGCLALVNRVSGSSSVLLSSIRPSSLALNFSKNLGDARSWRACPLRVCGGLCQASSNPVLGVPLEPWRAELVSTGLGEFEGGSEGYVEAFSSAFDLLLTRRIV